MSSQIETQIKEIKINLDNLLKYSQFYMYDKNYKYHIGVLIDLIDKLEKGKYNKIFKKEMRERINHE